MELETSLLFKPQIWLIFAAAIGVAELVAPGFFFLGFALGAAMMAGVLFFFGDMLAQAPYAWGWSLLIFAVLSGIAVLAMRLIFGKRAGETDVNDAPYKGDGD